ncbi:MAG TPA: four helix bundle protein [Nitrospira sp.]|nr:four helix bundle protein [Nitrospira sp.]
MDGEKLGDDIVEFSQRKNINRGYRKLTVWRDAIDYYALTCELFRTLPAHLRRVAIQQIAAVDSVHRNIAEGYCRRSIREYLQFLNVALASTGESVSGLHACRIASQIPREILSEQMPWRSNWKMD